MYKLQQKNSLNKAEGNNFFIEVNTGKLWGKDRYFQFKAIQM